LSGQKKGNLKGIHETREENEGATGVEEQDTYDDDAAQSSMGTGSGVGGRSIHTNCGAWAREERKGTLHGRWLSSDRERSGFSQR
jgi:hypothetical protein